MCRWLNVCVCMCVCVLWLNIWMDRAGSSPRHNESLCLSVELAKAYICQIINGKPIPVTVLLLQLNPLDSFGFSVLFHSLYLVTCYSCYCNKPFQELVELVRTKKLAQAAAAQSSKKNWFGDKVDVWSLLSLLWHHFKQWLSALWSNNVVASAGRTCFLLPSMLSN